MPDRCSFYTVEAPRLRAGGLAGLANHDLVTGEREQPGDPTPRAAEALRLLAARAEAPALRPVWGVAR